MPVTLINPTNWATRYCEEEKPVADVRPKYKIEMFGHNDRRRTMEILFSHGYVFSAEYRFRKFDDVYRYYATTMEEWKYIRTHFDEECKMVFGYLNHWEWNSVLNEYKTTTLDEFLYSIVGHKRPEKKIVTLEEFNREFEEFQRREYPTVEFNRPAERRDFNEELEEVDRINDQVMNEALQSHRPPIREESTTPSNSINYMNIVDNSRHNRRRRRRAARRGA